MMGEPLLGEEQDQAAPTQHSRHAHVGGLGGRLLVSFLTPLLDGSYMQNTNGIPHYRNLTWLEDDFFYEVQAAYLVGIS